MKPRNKKQRRIVELAGTLSQISEDQKAWFLKNLYKPLGYRTKKRNVCLECGHEWKNTDKKQSEGWWTITCPECGKPLNVLEGRARTKYESDYVAIVTTVEEYQVVRIYIAKRWCRVGTKAEYFLEEVVQQWIENNGHFTILSRACHMSFYIDVWNFFTGLEIRDYHSRHNPWPSLVYPEMKVHDIYTRNGFTGDFYDVNPFDLFRKIVSDSMCETLIKAKQFNILPFFIYQGYQAKSFWATLKICIRNKYIIGDAKMWVDYVQMLKSEGKDICNAKYVCPADLQAEHDKITRIIQKKRAELERVRDAQREAEREIRRQKQLAKLKEDEEAFIQAKKRFFDLYFSDETIEVVVLTSIDDYRKEGEILEHCVYSNAYYNKKDTLILSARKGDERIETIEISLEDWKVIQCRGYLNQNTVYHDKIISLVESNINQIKRKARMVA